MKEFNLFGHAITIDDDLHIYNEYRKESFKIIEFAQTEFHNFILNCSSIEELIKETPKIASKYIHLCIDENIKVLYKIGIKNIDRDIYINPDYS